LSGKLGPSVGVGRIWRVGFAQNIGGGRSALRADRRHKDEMAYADRFRRSRQLSGRQAVDPVIGLLGNLRPGMRNSGEMNHSLNVFQQRSPFDRAGQIGYGDEFDPSP